MKGPARPRPVKLKRERIARPAGPGAIRSRAASPHDPVLRRYIPEDADQTGISPAATGVLDWRAAMPARLENIAAAADRIILADAAQALARLPDNSIACVITSPPYWNVVDYGYDGQLGACSYEQYLDQLLAVWRECERTLVENGKLCIVAPIMPISKKVMPDQHTRHLKNLNNDIEATILFRTDLRRFSLFIWQKQTTEKMFGSYPYPPNLYEQNTIEFISVYVKPGRPRKFPRPVKETSRLTAKQWMDLTRQVWTLYPEDVKRVSHPAPFPESLPNRLIAMYTFAAHRDPDHDFAGDIVLDPFNGAGATCVAARKLGRRLIGIDLSPHFCMIAHKRIDRAEVDRKVLMSADKKSKERGVP